MRCYVLAGGRSSRMGVPKELLELGGQTFLERITNSATGAFEEVIVVGGEPVPGRKSIQDHPHRDTAPLFGILRALADAGEAGQTRIWIIAVDYPLLSAGLLRLLRAQFESTDAELLIPRIGGKPQMLCAGYSLSMLPGLQQRAARGDYALRPLSEQYKTRWVDEYVIASRFDLSQLRNVNTPQEYAELRRLYEETHAPR